MKNKYALVINGEISRYPIYWSELPEIMGHNRMTIEEFANANIYVVFPTEKGSKWDKNYVLGTPSFDGNVWKETWEEVDASPSEIDERLALKWEQVRHLRNKLLSISDYTQLPDSPLDNAIRNEWADYRQALRDITTQSDPFNIQFPKKPEA